MRGRRLGVGGGRIVRNWGLLVGVFELQELGEWDGDTLHAF
jgi:hypothetical protein